MFSHRVKIKPGSSVGQDHRFFKWEDRNMIFYIRQDMNTLYKLVGEGYGLQPGSQSYGNGALYVRKEDVIQAD